MKKTSASKPAIKGPVKAPSPEDQATANASTPVCPTRRVASGSLTVLLSASARAMNERIVETWLLKEKIDELCTWQNFVHSTILELKKATTTTRPAPILTARIEKILQELRPVSRSLHISSAISESKKAYKSANELFLLLFEFTERFKWNGSAARIPGVHPLEAVDSLILDYVSFALRCETAELNDADDYMSLKVGENWTRSPSKTHLRLIELVHVEFPDDNFSLIGSDVFLQGDEEAFLEFNTPEKTL